MTDVGTKYGKDHDNWIHPLSHDSYSLKNINTIWNTGTYHAIGPTASLVEVERLNYDSYVYEIYGASRQYWWHEGWKITNDIYVDHGITTTAGGTAADQLGYGAFQKSPILRGRNLVYNWNLFDLPPIFESGFNWIKIDDVRDKDTIQGR